jgi:hypothetical protein
MTRFSAALALATVSLALAPAASAQSTRGYYAATPATAPAKPSLMTRATVWRCGAATCTAARADARPAIMCELAARALGTLAAFRAGDAEFDAEALAKCNSKAR